MKGVSAAGEWGGKVLGVVLGGCYGGNCPTVGDGDLGVVSGGDGLHYIAIECVI